MSKELYVLLMKYNCELQIRQIVTTQEANTSVTVVTDLPPQRLEFRYSKLGSEIAPNFDYTVENIEENNEQQLVFPHSIKTHSYRLWKKTKTSN